MDYRIFRGEQFSTIGIGAGNLKDATNEEVARIISMAMDRGVNLMDTVMNNDEAVPGITAGLKGRRDKMKLQLHLCATYPKPSGLYVRTRELKAVKAGFEAELKKYHTDYADIGMIHCIDTQEELDEVLNGGIFDYLLKLKQDGVVRHMGFGSHEPAICKKLIDTGKIDLFMLSINPAYDLAPSGDKLAIAEDRIALYQECQKRDIGITVMKAYGGGQLLTDGTSPFGKAMSIAQCIQYVLDRPAVLSAIVGVRSVKEMEDALAYYDATKEQRDYSFIGGLYKQDIAGRCIYCNHCQPCPKGIDIGTVNKYMDLAKAGDELAVDHYWKLEKHADDCIQCGMCNKNCPFGVDAKGRIAQAKEFFKKK